MTLSKRHLLHAFLITGTVALVGCSKIQPVRPLVNQPIPDGLTTQQIQHDIRSAGIQRQWVINSVKPGVMEGRLDWRSYYVDVEIPYTKTSYSILYKNSANLNYHNGEIHRAYNKWVTMLNRDIQAQFAITTTKMAPEKAK
ncbi:MAG: hypothetical protein HKM04_03680 [Legionellales bacterium]|nr:hypothetical protein [Legionellales bacterium]